MMGKDLSALKIDPSSRAGKKTGRWVFVVAGAALVAVIAVLFTLIGRGRTVTVEYAVARNASGGPSSVLNASGYVTARRMATISSKITGKIREVFIEEGMSVGDGQILATLDDAEALAYLRAAEAERDVAAGMLAELRAESELVARNLERAKDLRKRDLNSEQDLDNAETSSRSIAARIEVAALSIEAAERNVAVARQNHDNCTIRAPFSGVVVSKDAQPGEMVSPVSAGGGYTRTGIATIVDMKSLEIEVDVNESYIARVSAGQRVEAVLDAYPDWRMPASVLTVIPTADRQKATVQVRIAFDQLDPRILPDMGVKVSFLENDRISPPASGGVMIPSGALKTDNGRQVVFVVNGSTAERRAVTAGREAGGEILITGGIRPGDKVAVGNTDNLRDGSRVRLSNP